MSRLRKTIKKILLSLGISGTIIIFGLFARNQWRKARALGTTRTYINAQNNTGLVLKYTMDDNDINGTTVYDKSGQGNNGTLGDGATPTTYPSSATGKLKEARSFDGGDYITVADTPFDFERTTAFTVSGWFKTSNTTIQAIVAKEQNSGDYTGWYIITSQLYEGNRLTFLLQADGVPLLATIVTGSTNILDGVWHKFDCVNLGNSGAASDIKIYIDGVLETMTTNSDTLGSNSILNNVKLRIGSRDNLGIPFTGQIDEVRIYNRALSATEVLNNYNSTKRNYIQATNTTGLVGMWDLDNASYNTTTDTIYGKYGSDLLTAVSDPALTTGFDGRANTAITFDGSADYLKQYVHDTQQGVLSYQGNDTTTAEFRDTTQNFADWQTSSGNAAYMIVVTNSDATISWGYCGVANNGLGTNDDINIFTTKALSTRGWNGTAPVAGGKTPSSYEVRKTDFQITGAMTLGAWVKASIQINDRFIIQKDSQSAGTRGFYLATESDANNLRIFVSADGTTLAYRNGQDNILDDQWHFVVGAYNASEQTLNVYVDGILNNGSLNGSVPASIYDTSNKVLIGANKALNQFFNGSIARPFVYSRALSAAEMLAMYNAQKRKFIQ